MGEAAGEQPADEWEDEAEAAVPSGNFRVADDIIPAEEYCSPEMRLSAGGLKTIECDTEDVSGSLADEVMA